MTAFYPKKYWLSITSYAVAVAMVIGMIEGDYHWASDVVAGALLSQTIGWTVGKRFRRAYDGNKPEKRSWIIVPRGLKVAAMAVF